MTRFLKRNWKYLVVVAVLFVILGITIYNTKLSDVSSVQNSAATVAGLDQMVFDPETGSYLSLNEFFDLYGHDFRIASDTGLPLDPETGLPINPKTRETLSEDEISILEKELDSSTTVADVETTDSSTDNTNTSDSSVNTVITIDTGDRTPSSVDYQDDVVDGDKTPMSVALREISDGSQTDEDRDGNRDATPEGKPRAVDLDQQSVDYSKSFTIYLTIDCTTLIDNPDLDPNLQKYVGNGYILEKTPVLCYAGENVFTVLSRECKARSINMESTYTPIYKSYYLEAINNLGEFDGGPNSGWLYKVDGWFPNYGCSSYIPIEGEDVVFFYTCDYTIDSPF